MELDELLSEAESEESKGIKWKHRKIKFRLLDFRQYLLENYALNTVKSVMINVIKFYKFYDVEINELPKINEKSIQKPQPIYFSDLPDKKIIRDALDIANPVMKALIVFICSSGCARAEFLILTIQDYIDALSEYLPDKNMSIYLMKIRQSFQHSTSIVKRQISIILPTAVQKRLRQLMHIYCPVRIL